MSDKQSVLPEDTEGWEVENLGELLHRTQYGISESMSKEGQYPIFRMNNIEKGYMVDKPIKYLDLDEEGFEKYRVNKGDILFNRTNSIKYVGQTGYFDLEDDFVFASYLIRLEPNEKVNNLFLNFYMNSKRGQDRLKTFATRGVSQANINATNLEKVLAPVPPISEQRRIASVLYSVDEQIRTLTDRHDSLTQLKHGLMQDLLTGETRVTPEMDVRNEVSSNPSEVRDTEEWKTYKIRDLIESRTGGVWGEDPDEGDYTGKVLRAGNYGDINIDLSDVAERHIPDTKRDRELSYGDIALERSGGSKNQPVGRVMFFNLDSEEDYYPTNFIEKIEVEDEYNNWFVYYLMNFKYYSKDTVRYQTNTTNIRNLQMDAYLASDVEVPSLWEQERIASVLYTADEMIARTSDLIDEYERLKRGLMQDLLSGNMRTPEDLSVLDAIELDGDSTGADGSSVTQSTLDV